MYNKIFTKILDSSIWLAPDPHRLVWITFIAAMDQNGYAQFACIENLAARARVSVEDTTAAVKSFESPDPYAPMQEYEGRRIERIEGGWFVLNAEKYRNVVTRAVANEQARIRMKKHREKLAVTQQLRSVTPSVSVSVSKHQSSEQIFRTLLKTSGKEPERTERLQGAIDAIGGWTKIRDCKQTDLAAATQAFCEAYEVLG